MTIIDDLVAEQDRLDAILEGLDDLQWASPSGCSGWSMTDVVLHLAQSEEAVPPASTAAPAWALDRPAPPRWIRPWTSWCDPSGRRQPWSSSAGGRPGGRRWTRCGA